MATRSFRNPIHFDWFIVTYRSVGLTVGAIALSAIAGGLYWYYFYSYGPKQEAAEAISRAATLLVKAEGLKTDEQLEEMVASARVALNEAHSAFKSHGYDKAHISAIRSENLSQQAINLASGNRATEMVRFYRIEGDVRVKRAGEFAWEPAHTRMLLNVGDQCKTASNASAQLIYFDGTVTTIGPGSLLEIQDLYEDPVTQVRWVKEKLNWGEVEASTQERNVEGSFHEVATETAAARAEEAGEFRVAYDRDDGTASFDVFEGRVEVASPAKRESLVAGERIRSSAEGTLSAKELIPGIPRLLAPADQKVFVDEDPSRIQMALSWEPVVGAVRYHLMISDKVLFTNSLYDGERTELSALLEGVQPGDYYWRVAAINRAGASGQFSKPRRFRVSSQVIRDRQDKTPPELEITQFVSVGPMLIINGVTEPGATLWVEEEKVDVSADGTFYAVVRLSQEGLSTVRFVAQDNAGNETRVERSAFVESY